MADKKTPILRRFLYVIMKDYSDSFSGSSGDQFPCFLRRQRSAPDEALDEVAAYPGETGEHLHGLHAFGHDAHLRLLEHALHLLVHEVEDVLRVRGRRRGEREQAGEDADEAAAEEDPSNGDA